MTRHDVVPDEPVVELSELTKDFVLSWTGRRFRAIDRLNLRVRPGEVLGLLGRNGCGKSTTLKMIIGLIRPSAGSSRVFGRPSQEHTVRRRIGYCPEAARFTSRLSGRKLVELHARIGGVPAQEVEARAELVLERVGLREAASRAASTYSRGMSQRLGLAQALVHDPELVVLDEFSAGLDPRGAEELAELVRDLKARGMTVVLTSHVLSEVEAMCDRVVLLERGRVMMEARVSDLIAQSERHHLLVDALSASQQVELQHWLAERGARLHAVKLPHAELDRLFGAASDAGEGTASNHAPR